MSRLAISLGHLAKLLALVICLLQCHAAPRIASVSPLAIVPGEKTVLTFAGTGLERMSNLWLSCGGRATRQSVTNGEIRFEVQCANVPNGITALQLYGLEGASDYRLQLVDDLKSGKSRPEGQSDSSPCMLDIPGAVDGALRPERLDSFRFSAKAGDAVTIEVLAHRIGSEADPVVRVLDSHGVELAFCDDEPSFWRDSRFVFSPPLDGQYCIEIHDAGFGGGPSYFYRLRVTREPIVSFAFPLPEPAEPVVEFQNPNSRSNRSPADPPEVRGLSIFPSLAEQEPNDSRGLAQRVPLPVTLHGLLQRSNDADYFQFHAAKDEQLTFQSATRRLGSPCDLVLRLFDLSGKLIASNDPGAATDAALTNTFPKEDDYLLQVQDLTGQIPDGVPYRLEMKQFTPGAMARVESNLLEVPYGSSTNLKAIVSRYRFDGQVRFNLENPIEGLRMEQNTIATNKNEVELRFTAGPPLKPGDLVHFRLKTTAGAGQTGYTSTAAALKKLFPLLLHPPAELTGLIALTVKQ